MAKKLTTVLGTLLTVSAVLLAVLLVGVRLIGFTPMAVLSGSMEPNFPVGSLVYVKNIDAENVAVGDVITFSLGDNVVATHRVVSIDYENGKFHTKGDANSSEDGSPVPFENLIGKVGFCIPKLGYVSKFLATTSGKIAAVSFVLLIAFLLLLPDFLSKKSK